MLAVIIVNYRTPELTIQTIESVISHANIPITIFVVENGSNDDSWSKFKNWRAPSDWKAIFSDADQTSQPISPQQLIFLKSGENRGFAGGNNLALSIAIRCEKIENLWLLNSDTELCGIPIGDYTNCLNNMKENVGILGCVVRYFDEPRTIQAIGGVISKYTGCSKLIAQSPYCGRLDFVSGASMLVRRRFILDIGLMSEDYFLYYEEADWARRGKSKGYTIASTARYTVLHKAGKSIGTSGSSSQRSWISDYYGFRNRYLYICKFYPMYSGVARIAVLASCLSRMLRSEFRRAWAIFRLALHIRAVLAHKNVIVNL